MLSIHEFWGKGEDYERLHEAVKRQTAASWHHYSESSFRFDVDTFRASRPTAGKFRIIESFSYLPFDGPIVMKDPQQIFTVFEEYDLHAPTPHMLFFGRWLAESGRRLVAKFDLKKRGYIATTSMDAELSLLTANIAKAAPGKLAYDPFMGTGSFPVACAAFGATTFGSDLDGRSIRGRAGKNVAANFKQYGTSSLYLGGCSADLTNSPILAKPTLDIVICDPPYGVREGLKVLGHVKERLQSEIILDDGTPAHLQQDYVPPKRPYSFDRLLDDILDFSAARLVIGGRLCMWMPVASTSEARSQPGKVLDGDTTQDSADQTDSMHTNELPQHPCLKLESVCQQDFTKWSRRLLTYSRLRDEAVDAASLSSYHEFRQAVLRSDYQSRTADELNHFRMRYFQGFKA